MVTYIARRFMQGIVAVLLLAVVVFGLSRMTGGDPLALLLPVDATQETEDRVAEQIGLDKSIPEQFWIYLTDVVQGDFGESIKYRTPVWEMFADRWGNSLRLVVPAFVLALAVGVPLGVIGARSKSRIVQRALGGFGVLGMATPVFWLAIVLIFLFSVRLGWVPSARIGGFKSHILPVCSLSLFLIAGIMQLVRSSMLEQLNSEYVKMARIKGVSERSVVWKHALRNSLTSTVSFLGVYFSVLVTGSIVVEKVFAWPGIGRLLLEGILGRDYPVVQGIILLSAMLIVLVNLLVDILYAFLDPRIRY